MKLPCEMRVLTLHFERPVGAKIFYGLFAFWCQYCPFSVQLRYVFASYFLSGIEPVTPIYPLFCMLCSYTALLMLVFILYMIFNNFPMLHTFDDVLQTSLPYLFEFKMRFFL